MRGRTGEITSCLAIRAGAGRGKVVISKQITQDHQTCRWYVMIKCMKNG